jgi:23S rRNA (uracil1939-C5)-methyltransferase
LIEETYEEQVGWKQEFLASQLAAYQKQILPFVKAEKFFGYRNRAKLMLRPPNRFGLYQKGSHKLVDIPDCPIHMNDMNSLAKRVMTEASQKKLSIYNEQTHKGLLRAMIIRQSQIRKGLYLILVTRDKNFPQGKTMARDLLRNVSGLVGVSQNINPEKGNVIEGKETILLAGKSHYKDRIGSFSITVSGSAFLQGNHKMAAKIYQSLAKNFPTHPKDLIFDLYAGCGLAGMHVAKKVKQVVGMDQNETAIQDAKKNAKQNQRSNMKFLGGDVDRLLLRAEKRWGSPEGVIVNPPRRGCSQKVLDWLLHSNTKKIAYVSCSPKSLRRDLDLLTQKDQKEPPFQVRQIQGFDLYPQTQQIESLVILQR